MNAFDAPSGSLRGRVGKGAAWTAAGQVVRTGTQLASVVILSRLLTPEDFGVVAMCGPVLAFILLFQDLGLTQATIQKPELTHAEVNCLFWVNVAVGVALAGLLVAGSSYVADFYGEPRAGSLTAALSVQILLYGLGAQHYSLLSRRMEFGRLAAISAVSGVVGLAVSVAFALYERTYWALFAGTLATALCSTLGHWLYSQWRPGLPAWHKGVGQLLQFGAGLTGFNFVNFFARNLDGVLIGRYWGGVELGHYDRANKLLLFPLNHIMNPLNKVMVPALSRANGDDDRYRNAYLKTTSLVLFLILPGIAFATATADILIPMLLGPQWGTSATIFQALGFAGLLQALNNPAGWLFISQGRTGEFMRWGLVSSTTVVAAFVIGLPYGALGVAIAYAVGEYIRTPLLWLYIGRKGPIRFGHILRVSGPVVLAAHAALAATWLARRYWHADPVLTLFGSAGLCLSVSAAVTLLFPGSRAVLLEAFALGMRRFRPKVSVAEGSA